jgi:hypothetical protein
LKSANQADGFVTGLQGTNFQFTGDPILADWLSGSDYNAYQYGDKAPMNAGYYYLPSDKKISQAYYDYLFSLQPVGFNTNQEYVTALTVLQHLADDQTSKVSL